MKYAVCITETLSKTIIVEANSYEQAEQLVADEYYNCDIILYPEDCSVDTEFIDDTSNYIDIFGKDKFDKDFRPDLRVGILYCKE